MGYTCTDCGREISREELEESRRIVCPDCGSYSLRKTEDLSEENSEEE